MGVRENNIAAGYESTSYYHLICYTVIYILLLSSKLYLFVINILLFLFFGCRLQVIVAKWQDSINYQKRTNEQLKITSIRN